MKQKGYKQGVKIEGRLWPRSKLNRQPPQVCTISRCAEFCHSCSDQFIFIDPELFFTHIPVHGS